ncbi:bifunctional tRNA (5-methylaminomethyl-2-thiouridine)(34)-methyltransferase MnmD/FAD-dependent 5-carboxymethylaminomethyl-2-thiouridine(34) oxidoreductase MnmC [Microbulbifer discodermiae]|uniref:bifunctional tRNA (5-methylaminomethyl-2-thiouridine)(34)-methyltransferase MnmD/FAD-dependent 5-carboxymethylaminomethyl-2-thiouridine(34) oxidoreductase MnmC n=1 Tax=Microbulbifer sp. 2201CG32-9 TaxID=3232309 RepID=UPI00345BAF5D
MNSDDRQAQVEWRQDSQPVSRTFGDVYFSSASGLAETRYVFLQQNDLPARWRSLAGGATFTIGETGFGTGLNFLAACALWHETAPADARLHFVSVEKYPLHPRDLDRALDLWPQLQEYADRLREQYPPLLAPGVHRLHFDSISLTLVIGDASAAFVALRTEHPAYDASVDAWFLDGFAPAKNPAMWTPELFRQIAELSKPGASFATFTSAGSVKRGLQDTGFAVQKVAGFGRKRDMLRGQLKAGEKPPGEPFSNTPWHQPDYPPLGSGIKVAVVGAGIAGAACARALAERGCRVEVFECGPQPGHGASGNEQGILYAKLSPQPGPNGDFNLHALMFAQRYYRDRCPTALHSCGLLQLGRSDREQILQRQVAERLAAYRGQTLARPVSTLEASALAGIELGCPGLFFPKCGWLQPRILCGQLLQHDKVRVHCNTSVQSLAQSGDTWNLETDQGTSGWDAVIVCSATGLRQLHQTAPLPLQPIRGQVSIADAAAAEVHIVLCADGYLTPAYRGRQSFGATFKLKDSSTDLRQTEHGENLAVLKGLHPDLATELTGREVTGRAAVRAATPDYLPIAGPVPDWEALAETYAHLRQNRKALIPTRTHYQRGLFVLAGLGSRGFTYAPLAAELVAAWIDGGAPPVDSALVKALHPARFAVRALGRHRS